jgi:hypothetical protein
LSHESTDRFFRAVAIRPYGPNIRTRVFALLERAGVMVAERDVIPKGTSDDDVIEALRTRRARVLLAPFHAHRDDQGRNVNGVDTVLRVVSELPNFERVPIIMPVSSSALAAANLRLEAQGSGAIPKSVRDRIFVIDEAELDQPALLARLVGHLRLQFTR